jgi:hypothetical protein
MRMERTSSHAVLNSFCRILRATCNAVISAVSTARTHEVLGRTLDAIYLHFPLVTFISNLRHVRNLECDGSRNSLCILTTLTKFVLLYPTYLTISTKFFLENCVNLSCC